MSLLLTFGGSPNPPTWCMFLELVSEVANEITQCAEWDPVELRSPVQLETSEPIRLPSDVPIAMGREMAVLVSQPARGGKVDGFIDDLIYFLIDTPENYARQSHVVPLAMHATSRPHEGESEEPVPRRPILSLPKLIAEGRPRKCRRSLVGLLTPVASKSLFQATVPRLAWRHQSRQEIRPLVLRGVRYTGWDD
jgi:hypothetical protein